MKAHLDFDHQSRVEIGVLSPKLIWCCDNLHPFAISHRVGYDPSATNAIVKRMVSMSVDV